MLRSLTLAAAAAAALVTAAPAAAQTTGYSDRTTLVSGFANAGAATTTTYLVADDITVAPGFAGAAVTGYRFSVANFNTAAASARPLVRFYAADGTGGGPGTLLGGGTFGATTVNANAVTVLNYNPGTTQFTVPASGTFWAGIAFDNAGTSTATTAQLNQFGQGIYNPPTVGSSTDTAFRTAAADTAGYVTSGPAGGFFNFNGSPVANFGWEFVGTPVPEPTGLLAAGAALASIAIARRARRGA